MTRCDAEFWRFLACPTCKSALVREGSKLKCMRCHVQYPVVDGVPVLLDADSLAAFQPLSLCPTTKLKHRWTPRVTLNTGAASNMACINRLLHQRFDDGRSVPVILNVGAGSRFPGSEQLDPQFRRAVVNLDVRLFPSADVIGDAHKLAFLAASIDLVICQAVLEHVAYPEIVVREIWRVLKLGGLVYVELPFLQGYHPTPRDFRRYTLEGIQHFMTRLFVELDSGVCVGPSSALTWVLRDYLTGLLTGFNSQGRFYRYAKSAFSWLTVPIKYLDLLVANKPQASNLAAGVYFLGEKNAVQS